MISYNLIIVLDESKDNVLMCKRQKDPYLGMYNLVGGKIDIGEDVLDSAYRELFEETGITKQDILLKPFIDFTWHPIDMEMKVFIGKLNKSVELVEEANPLFWIDINTNFFDMDIYAGEGNIGHMFEIYKQQIKELDL